MRSCIAIFLALAVGDTESSKAAGLMASLTFQAIGIGLLTGVLGGILGSHSVRYCASRKWVTGPWLQIPVIALSLLCFSTANWFQGSGFIACFVSGLIFGGTGNRNKQIFLDAAEGVGNTMALVTWFLFGVTAVGATWTNLDWRVLLYATLSLTLIRIFPVFISLLGLKLRWNTNWFLGWFGPRGLASIVFVVIVQDQSLPGSDILVTTVTWTILLSILLHGISANSLSGQYGRAISSEGGII